MLHPWIRVKSLTPSPLPPALPPHLPLTCPCSNQGSIKSALSGKASENVRGRVDQIIAELNKKGPEVPVQVRQGGIGQAGGAGGAGRAGQGTCQALPRACSPALPSRHIRIGAIIRGFPVIVLQVCMATQDNKHRKPPPPVLSHHFLSRVSCPLFSVLQVFMATLDDNYRKPATGMWDFFVQNANKGVQPDLRWAAGWIGWVGEWVGGAWCLWWRATCAAECAWAMK